MAHPQHRGLSSPARLAGEHVPSSSCSSPQGFTLRESTLVQTLQHRSYSESPRQGVSKASRRSSSLIRDTVDEQLDRQRLALSLAQAQSDKGVLAVQLQRLQVALHEQTAAAAVAQEQAVRDAAALQAHLQQQQEQQQEQQQQQRQQQQQQQQRTQVRQLYNVSSDPTQQVRKRTTISNLQRPSSAGSAAATGSSNRVRNAKPAAANDAATSQSASVRELREQLTLAQTHTAALEQQLKVAQGERAVALQQLQQRSSSTPLCCCASLKQELQQTQQALTLCQSEVYALRKVAHSIHNSSSSSSSRTAALAASPRQQQQQQQPPPPQQQQQQSDAPPPLQMSDSPKRATSLATSAQFSPPTSPLLNRSSPVKKNKTGLATTGTNGGAASATATAANASVKQYTSMSAAVSPDRRAALAASYSSAFYSYASDSSCASECESPTPRVLQRAAEAVRVAQALLASSSSNGTSAAAAADASVYWGQQQRSPFRKSRAVGVARSPLSSPLRAAW
jgi:hypothetical protein